MCIITHLASCRSNLIDKVFAYMLRFTRYLSKFRALVCIINGDEKYVKL